LPNKRERFETKISKCKQTHIIERELVRRGERRDQQYDRELKQKDESMMSEKLHTTT
jgi:hypothetical protein